jgi:hypothetical protein
VRAAVISGVSTGRLLPARLHAAVERVAVLALRSRLVARGSAAMMRLTPQARAGYLADISRLSAGTVRTIYRELLEPGAVPASTDRLLAVAGDREARAIRRDLVVLAAAGATAALVPRAAHAWVAEHPDLFARMVDDWVERGTLPPELVPVPAVAAPAPR